MNIMNSARGNHPHWRQVFIGMVCLLFSTVAMADEPQMIVYLGTNDFPLENAEAATRAGITLAAYNLDAQKNLEHHLMEGLPIHLKTMDSIGSIQSIVEQRINDLPQEEIMAIFQPVMLVQRWDIRKTPAAVFGKGEAVVYGITDANLILEYWQEWQSTRSAGEGLQ
ncbi:MAG: TIGR03757 family integrating conjugative element protein [Gammaproteobacteria bacterium]|nr:TIGR03757 family integrating conjugative element protein [Gammaproteobacteria bacterium]